MNVVIIHQKEIGLSTFGWRPSYWSFVPWLLSTSCWHLIVGILCYVGVFSAFWLHLFGVLSAFFSAFWIRFVGVLTASSRCFSAFCRQLDDVLFRRRLVSVLSASCRRLVSVLSTYCRRLIAVLSASCRRIASVLSAYFRRLFQQFIVGVFSASRQHYIWKQFNNCISIDLLMLINIGGCREQWHACVK